MRYCPKCETIYEDDDEVCPPCGIELVDRLKRREEREELEEDHAREFFADEGDVMRFCPTCMREFTPTSRICTDCGGIDLMAMPRAAFERSMARSRVHAFRVVPEEHPEVALVRVLEAPSPSHAAFAAMSLEGMGVDASIGDDALEPEPDSPGVGIFVPADEVEACSMIIPEDLDEWFEDEDEDDEAPAKKINRSPYERKLGEAEGYRRIGRLRHATSLVAEAIEIDPDLPAAFIMLGQISAERAQYARAAECFEEAVKREQNPVGSQSMWLFIGHALLDDAGQPRLKGEAADRALEALESFCAKRPRLMAAWLLKLELLDVRDAKTKAAEAVAQIRKINRWLLELDGPAKACVERWKL